MKKNILTIAIILLTYFVGFAQTAEDYNNKISELKKKKSNIQLQIQSLRNDLKNVNGQIKALEQRKSVLTPQFASVDGIKAYISSGGATLREASNINGKIITTLKEGDVIYVQNEHNGLYLKVNYQGTFGFVNYSSIKQDAEIDKLMVAKKPIKSTTTITSVDTNSAKYKRLKKLYGHDKAIKMCSSQLWKDMSTGQIRESLGVPSSSSKENTPRGLKEIWKYSNKELIIINGSLESWTNK